MGGWSPNLRGAGVRDSSALGRVEVVEEGCGPHGAPLRMTDARCPDVWLADVTDPAFQALADSDLPSPEDRARAEGMADPDRARILVARRAALRVILAQHTGCDPRSIRIVVAPGGKPVLVPDARGGPSAAFSVAHSGDLFAVAVGSATSLGLDVERTRTLTRARQIATRWFGAAEAATLDDISDAELDAEFMRLWTAKEALAKRHGAGLRLMKGPVAELDIQSALDDGRLRHFHVADGYCAALASSEVVQDIQIIRPSEDEWTI